MNRKVMIVLAIAAVLVLSTACAPAPTPVPPTPVPPTQAPPTLPPPPTPVPPTATIAATAAPTAVPGVPAASVEKLVNDTFNTVDTNLALWNIQPGLGTVMLEYSNRLSRLWFSANAAHWDMAKYQLDEMTEIQEVGETTRPSRAPMLKAFEDGFLKPMDAAILAKDKDKAATAYKNISGGCNGCHAASSGDAATAGYSWKSYAFVQIQMPQTDPAAYVMWNAGAGNTGNYSPAASSALPTAASTQAV